MVQLVKGESKVQMEYLVKKDQLVMQGRLEFKVCLVPKGQLDRKDHKEEKAKL